MYQKSSKALFDFIENSPSVFHVVENVEKELMDHGFVKLHKHENWELKNGGKYFLTSNQSTLIAFELPKEAYEGFQIVGSHSDVPTFKIKANPEVKFEESYTSLSVEKYGGVLCAPWFDRPLSIAGRVLYEEEGTIEEKTIDFGYDCLSIVNLAIHLNREANKGVEYKIQKDMMPIWAGHGNEKKFQEEVAHIAEIAQEKILDTELFVYNRMKGSIWGANKEFISCPRLDDLQCVFSSKTAFLEAENNRHVKVLGIFDNEEVGSRTKQGALSSLLASTLERIGESQGKTVQQRNQDLANSFMLSADNAHAVHPNYSEKSDKTNHTFPNGGVVVKYSASQQYATDARTASYVKLLCKESNVPFQIYHDHSDHQGGSTLGNLATQQVAIPAADIGAAQLAMHSPYETGGVKDTYYLKECMKAFYEK